MINRALLSRPSFATIGCIDDYPFVPHRPSILRIDKIYASQCKIGITLLPIPGQTPITGVQNGPPPSTGPSVFFGGKTDRKYVVMSYPFFLGNHNTRKQNPV
jgi:hypothetical protein